MVAGNAPLTLEVSKRALHRVRNRLFPIEDDADIIEACYLSKDSRKVSKRSCRSGNRNGKGYRPAPRSCATTTSGRV